MNIDERIRAAVLPIVPICEPDFYDGEETTYCTFNMNEVPTGFGNNRARGVRYLIQLHLFAPGWPNPPSTRKVRWDLCRAILDAGFTAPHVENASDRDEQHYVLEFEWVGPHA